MHRQLLLAQLASQAWAMHPDHLANLSNVLHRWAAGGSAAPDISAEIEAAQAARSGRKQSNAAVGGGIAVLPLYGVISQRASMVDEMCGAGGTSTEKFTQSFRELMADDSIGGIIIDIDSPGGSVFGVADLCGEIMSARGVKPVYGVVNSLCASAAYWLGSACSQLIAVQGSMTGSIGVYTQHVDMSGALEMEGIKAQYISAGKYKVEGNSYGPLDEEARAFTQSQIDAYYSAFTSAVSKGRGAPIGQVRDGMGQGRCLMAADALAAGMVDAIDTFDGAVKRMSKAMKAGPNAAALQVDVVATAEVAAPGDNPAPPLPDESAGQRAAARARALQLASA